MNVHVCECVKEREEGASARISVKSIRGKLNWAEK